MSTLRCLAGVAFGLLCSLGHAADFKTVGPSPVILYDAPSTRGTKLFVAPRGMPLEVVISYGDWVKVRDVSGDLAWTEASGLNNKRALVVRSAGLKVRSSPDDKADTVFIADKGVLLEALEPAAGGWIKLRHKDGQTGYAKSADVWGN